MYNILYPNLRSTFQLLLFTPLVIPKFNLLINQVCFDWCVTLSCSYFNHVVNQSYKVVLSD